MKRVLLFLVISLCVLLTLNAQTITSTVPATVDVGTDLSISYTYTNPDPGVVYIALELYNGDVWKSDVASYELNPAAHGTGVSDTVNILVPSSTITTANLGIGQSYKVNVKLYNSGWGRVLTQHLKDIELTGTSTIAPTITSTVPATVKVGTDLSISYTYTNPDTGVVYIALALYDGDVWKSEVASYELNPVAQGTGVSNTATISVPPSTTTTDNLEAGQSYKVNVKLYSSGWGRVLTQHLKDIELAGTTAGIEDINVDGLVMYPNPVSDILRIKNVGVSEIMSFQIVDILGKVVIKQNNDKKVNSIDVSELSKGLYFLISDNNRQFKFLKN